MTDKPPNLPLLGSCTDTGQPVILEAEIKATAKGKRWEMRPLYSGNTIQQTGAEFPVVLNVAGGMLQPGLVALLEHDPDQVAGPIEKIYNETTNGLPSVCASGAFADTPAARKIVREKRAGKHWKASIHAVGIAGQVRHVGEGEKLEANGRHFVGPLKYYTQWLLVEGSFVDRGADAYAAAAVYATATNNNHLRNPEQKENNEMNEDLKAYIESLGFKPEDCKPELLQAFEEALKERNAAVAKAAAEAAEKKDEPCADADTPAEPPAEDTPEDVPAAADPEQEPQAEDPEGVQASAGGRPRRPSPKNLGVHGAPRRYDDDRPQEYRLWEIGLLSSMGGMTPDEIKASGKYTQKEMDAALSNPRYYRASLQSFAGAVNRQAGFGYAPPRQNDAFAEDFFSALRQAPSVQRVMASGALFSTLPALGMLRNIANCRLRFYYERYTGIASKLSEEINAVDLKPFFSYEYDIAGGLLKVEKDGHIESATVSEAEYESKVETHARNLMITEEDIINDSLNAFGKLTKLFGRKGAISLERAWWKRFLAKKSAKFTTAKGNAMNANTPLTYNNICAALAKFSEMESIGSTSEDVEFVDAEPRYLLVAPAQYKKALDLVNGNFLTVNTSDGTVQGRSALTENLEVLSAPYFGAKMGEFGGSDNHWGIFADPVDCPVQTVAYYNGIKTPQVTTTESDPEYLGQIFTVKFRWGLGDASDKCGIYADGNS